MVGFLIKTKIKTHEGKREKRKEEKGGRAWKEGRERKPLKVFCLKALDISKAPLFNLLLPDPTALFL